MDEHRRHPRKPLHPDIAFQVGDGPRVEASCLDVSLGGMFIETATPAPFNAAITVFMKLPGLKQEARIAATVRWTKPGGMGVQFGVMGARDTHALTELLSS